MTEETRTVVIGPDVEALRMRKFEFAWGDQHQSFESRKVRIGSDPRSDFVVEAPSVSRTHCVLEVDSKGYRLEDRGSKNGTRVNGVQLVSGYIEPGASIELGEERLSFDCSADEVEIPLSQQNSFGSLLGTSAEMREVFALLKKVAPSRATVLMEGDSGTGKELAARAVHDASDRSDKPFIVFDCSAVSHDIIESELFGHVKGAFTGANEARKGAFEEANGGTLFLDEIGELAPELQPKLLRVLESQTIRPVGANRQQPVDTRIIAATNRSLEEEVEHGTFREDLYYRLAVIRVVLPPLRERTEDIPLLVRHFLDEFSGPEQQLNVGFETMDKLTAHSWPGNVRELRNYIERAALLVEGNELGTDYLSMQPRERIEATDSQAFQTFDMLGVGTDVPFKEAKEHLVEQFERSYWKRALEEHDGNVSAAARAAGVHRKSAEYVVKKLGLKP